MSIKFNEYTWYSKLAAIIFFIAVLPAWTFYLGMQYQSAQTSLDAANRFNAEQPSLVRHATTAATTSPIVDIDKTVLGYIFTEPGAQKFSFAYQFPNQYDAGANDAAPQSAADSKHLLSIPFHSSSKILRVYVNADSLFLVLYDPLTKVSTSLGKLKEVSYAGNSGGVFVPVAITKDDKNILARAYMDSPGAGGGSDQYGYTLISTNPQRDSDDYIILNFKRNEITNDAVFYDSYGKAVYTTEGDNLPIDHPGPTNSGVLNYRNLVTGETKVLLKEPQTGYKIINVDEQKKLLNIEATQYAFSATCESMYCAQVTASTTRALPLP